MTIGDIESCGRRGVDLAGRLEFLLCIWDTQKIRLGGHVIRLK